MPEDTRPLDRVRLARRPHDPRRAVARRVGFALLLIAFIALVVLVGRDGYTDVTGDPVGLIDALYYASVTVTTTGYGDISAVTTATRLATVLLITPARIIFLILVVGTTVEVLTEQYRQLLAVRRWREDVQDHFVICGFGATGRSAARALLADGVDPSAIVVVDSSVQATEEATEDGFASVHGDASRTAVLGQAAVASARSVIVTPNRDDTAVLITLTARQANPTAHIVTAVRERENKHLLRQSGADAVIDSSAAVGRLLGLATQTPSALGVIDDLLDVGTSLELAEVAPSIDPDGRPAVPADTQLLTVIRGNDRLPFTDPATLVLRPDDRLLVVRPTDGA